MRIYRDKDVDLGWLRRKTCAVIGFGAQGRAHALNTARQRDACFSSDFIPVANRGRWRNGAGIEVVSTAEAARRGDIIFVALPDTKMPSVYKTDIASSLRAGQTLLFAHGFAIHYRTVRPPNDVDVVLVAPKGLGPMVRREFVRGRGAPGLIAIHQDATGKAKRTALAWAKESGAPAPA